MMAFPPSGNIYNVHEEYASFENMLYGISIPHRHMVHNLHMSWGK